MKNNLQKGSTSFPPRRCGPSVLISWLLWSDGTFILLFPIALSFFALDHDGLCTKHRRTHLKWRREERCLFLVCVFHLSCTSVLWSWSFCKECGNFHVDQVHHTTWKQIPLLWWPSCCHQAAILCDTDRCTSKVPRNDCPAHSSIECMYRHQEVGVWALNWGSRLWPSANYKVTRFNFGIGRHEYVTQLQLSLRFVDKLKQTC